MTKQTIKMQLHDVQKILDMDYHDYLAYYNENVFPVGQMETDFCTVFTSQRKICKAIIYNILREL